MIESCSNKGQNYNPGQMYWENSAVLVLLLLMFNGVIQSIINTFVFPINSLVARNQVFVSSTVKRFL